MFFFTVYFEQCTPEYTGVQCTLQLCTPTLCHDLCTLRSDIEKIMKIRKSQKPEIKSRGSIACGPMRK